MFVTKDFKILATSKEIGHSDNDRTKDPLTLEEVSHLDFLSSLCDENTYCRTWNVERKYWEWTYGLVPEIIFNGLSYKKTPWNSTIAFCEDKIFVLYLEYHRDDVEKRLKKYDTIQEYLNDVLPSC